MDNELIAVLIREGSKIFTEVIRSNQGSKRTAVEVEWPTVPDQLPNFVDPFAPKTQAKPIEKGVIDAEYKVIPGVSDVAPVNYAPVQSTTGEKVATSCVGCAIGHLATVAGLLKEAVRFTGEGMDSPNIVDRLNTCLDELNAMERVDLQPAKIVVLPDWEKELAHRAINISRETRHVIEAGITSGDMLEQAAANLINERQAIGNAWLQQKLRALSTTDKAEIQRRVMAKLEKIGAET